MSGHHPYLDARTPLAFAHRGGAAEGDENTAAAFGRALAMGYRYLETDVRATSDGVAVVFHDATLERMAGRSGSVGTLSWADLSTTRVAGEASVLRLDETLDAWPAARFNIDVKSADAIGPTVAAIDRAGARDRVLLASFSDRRLARLRAALGPDVATSLGQRDVARLWFASRVGRRLRLPGSAVAAQVPIRYGRILVTDRRFVDHAHRLGLQVHVWTVDDPATIEGLLDIGVDGVMTDRLNVLRDVYTRRGVWRPPSP